MSENLNNLKKSECISLLQKIIKRVSKEEKPKVYRGLKSPTYCGNGKVPQGRSKGSSAICIRKGVGVGKAIGKLEGINIERDRIFKMIEKVLR
jgi:hypothetical protein